MAFRPDELPASSPGVGGAPPAGTAAARKASGVVERAVANAYQILDEQFRLGREAAHHHSQTPEEGNPVNNYMQQSADGMFQMWAEMFGWWLDMMGPWVPPALREAVRAYGIRSPGSGGGPVFPPGYAPPFPPGFPFPFPQGTSSPYSYPSPAGYPSQSGYSSPAGYPSPYGYPSPSGPSYSQTGCVPVRPSQASPLGVTLDLTSSRRVEVHVELTQDTEYSQLLVQELVGFTPADRITGVKLEADRDGFPVLRLSVASNLREGVYFGGVFDSRSTEPRGSVRVLVHSLAP